MKRVGWALALSFVFHLAMVMVENALGPDSKAEMKMDSIGSWPAWFCSQLIPPGHGIPQLVFPFLFSLMFYAAIFWLFLTGYAFLNRK
jgi:hypothetical protein